MKCTIPGFDLELSFRYYIGEVTSVKFLEFEDPSGLLEFERYNGKQKVNGSYLILTGTPVEGKGKPFTRRFVLENP